MSESRNWWGPLWPLGEALRFLTIVPMPGLPPTPDGGMGRAVACFPLAGAVLGGLLVGMGLLAELLWTSGVRDVLVVVAWAVLSAGLHLDGLSDTFDAVLSWRSRERKLEIMRDSRIGVMGALALVVVLALKVAFLGAMGGQGELGVAWWQAVLLAPIVGRWAMSFGLCGFAAARTSGLGQSVQSQTGRRTLLFSSSAALLLSVLVGGWRGLLALLVVALVAWLLARWWVRDLGGLTGDTYGALCELSEVTALAVLSTRLLA